MRRASQPGGDFMVLTRIILLFLVYSNVVHLRLGFSH
jgi:hypothetical protein